jgi:hypothetical protein
VLFEIVPPGPNAAVSAGPTLVAGVSPTIRRSAPAPLPARIWLNDSANRVLGSDALSRLVLLKSVKAQAAESTAGATPTVPAQIQENSC